MTSNSTPEVRKSNSLHMIATLGGAATLSGLLIVIAAKATEAGIRQNQAEFLRSAIFEVLPGATERKTFLIEGETLSEVPEGQQLLGQKVYAGYKEGALIGVAVEASGMGYQDVVRVLFGYDPERQALVGFAVLESKETPGLGDRIGKDAAFLANFGSLDVQLNGSQDALAQAIELVKGGARSQPWQVEGISGATISSKTVVRILNERCGQVLPVLVKNLEQLKKGA